MGPPQPTDAGWSSLPAPLAKRILRQTSEDSDRALLAWLRLSLVSKCDPHLGSPIAHP